MKAFVLAAGLGKRLRPFTLTNSKALVEVAGVPMLERVILRLKEEGFDDIVINIHHFGDKIIDFLKRHDNFGLRIRISDERDILRDTGGALLHAAELLTEDGDPFLIHNVDILSNASLGDLMESHNQSGRDATLLVSDRDTSRKLIFDDKNNLIGWHNSLNGVYRPDSIKEIILDSVFTNGCHENAFSGIHIMNPLRMIEEMNRQGRNAEEPFSVIDYYLEAITNLNVGAEVSSSLSIIDIGKPATLSQANNLLSGRG